MKMTPDPHCTGQFYDLTNKTIRLRSIQVIFDEMNTRTLLISSLHVFRESVVPEKQLPRMGRSWGSENLGPIVLVISRALIKVKISSTSFRFRTWYMDLKAPRICGIHTDMVSVLSVHELGKSSLSRDCSAVKMPKILLHRINWAGLRGTFCHSSEVLVFICGVSLGLRNVVPDGKLLRNVCISETALRWLRACIGDAVSPRNLGRFVKGMLAS